VPDLLFASAGLAMVRDRFRRFNIKLPAGAWSKLVAGRMTVPAAVSSPSIRKPQTTQPLLFLPGSNSPPDLAHQFDMHELYDSMFMQLTAAIEFGFNLYRQSAGLIGVTINGPQALGGQLQGPNLEPLIRTAPSVVTWTGTKVALRDAVAKGLDQQWAILAASVKVPGLPWYPAFAAFPGPVAPPTPNVPTPFSVLTQDVGATTPAVLKTAMRACLHGQFDYSDEFFESISTGFDFALRLWKGVQMVNLVMGTGPVPNFAPPYIPVAPVIGGTILPGSHINT